MCRQCECRAADCGDTISKLVVSWMSRVAHHFALLALALGACVPAAPPAPSSDHAEPTVTPVPQRATEAVPVDAQSVELLSCPPVDANRIEQLREIEAQVSQLRGLPVVDSIDRLFVPADDLRDQVFNAVLDDLSAEAAEARARTLYLLGLIPTALDLRALSADLLAEQAAGFYDRHAGQIVMVCESRFSGLAQFSYVHEFALALLDQHLDTSSGLLDEALDCAGNSQRCNAERALFEGAAALLQEQWLRTFASAQDIDDLRETVSAYSMPVFELRSFIYSR